MLLLCISYDSIDFLKLPSIEASQPGFDVRYRDAQFCGCESTVQGRIRIAVNQNPIRTLLKKHFFDST
jgi:hypothetical protein